MARRGASQFAPSATETQGVRGLELASFAARSLRSPRLSLCGSGARLRVVPRVRFRRLCGSGARLRAPRLRPPLRFLAVGYAVGRCSGLPRRGPPGCLALPFGAWWVWPCLLVSLVGGGGLSGVRAPSVAGVPWVRPALLPVALPRARRPFGGGLVLLGVLRVCLSLPGSGCRRRRPLSCCLRAACCSSSWLRSAAASCSGCGGACWLAECGGAGAGRGRVC